MKTTLMALLCLASSASRSQAARWAPPAPMPSEQMFQIHQAIYPEIVTGAKGLPEGLLNFFRQDHLAAQLKLSALGAMNLPRRDYTGVPARNILNEVVSAYNKAVPVVLQDMRNLSRDIAADVRAGRMDAVELAKAAEALKAYRLYGAEVGREVDRVKSMALAASIEDSLDLAKKIAEHFLGAAALGDETRASDETLLLSPAPRKSAPLKKPIIRK